jgi:hypothetical protein
MFSFIRSHLSKGSVAPAIGWLTHFYDPEAQAAFRRLVSEAADWGRVIQFRDGVGVRDCIGLFEDGCEKSTFEVVVLSKQQMAKACPSRYRAWRALKDEGRDHGGFIDIVLMAIATHLCDHDYVWLMESDVDFIGNWGTFFEEFLDCEADLLGTALYPRSQSKQWYHWPTFGCPRYVDPSTPTRGFFPVARLSRRFVRSYLEEVRNGWSGHYEALWPTIALHKGLRVEDIGGFGPLVPPRRRGHWYVSSHKPELSEGSFRYRPAVASHYYPLNDTELPANHLCHPIKTMAWLSTRKLTATRQQ